MTGLIRNAGLYAATASVGPIFFQDTFTGSALALDHASYTPDVGTGWTEAVAATGVKLQRNGSGVCVPASDILNDTTLFLADDAPAGTDVEVRVTVGAVGVSTNTHLFLFLGYSAGDGYAIRWNSSGTVFSLNRVTTDALTNIGALGGPPVAGETLALRRQGTTLTVLVDDVEVAGSPVVDGTHTHIGQCGIGGGGWVNSTQDWETDDTLTSFEIENL